MLQLAGQYRGVTVEVLASELHCAQCAAMPANCWYLR